MVWGSRTGLIFFNNILFDGKVNLVGAFGRSNFKIPNRFQKRREKQHKNQGKTGIFTQNRFSTKLILDFIVTQINVYTCNFYLS